MHNCLTGCIVQCSNIVYDADGNYKTSALEFETITMLGANCDIGDSFDDVADLDRLCDDIGLDTIETGAAVAVYMDAGEMEVRRRRGAKALLREIADRGPTCGKAIGNGALARRGKKHQAPPRSGREGQAIPAWDPRPLKATGVTYATSPMGADHTAGLIVNPGMQPDRVRVRPRRRSQLVNAVCDSSGFCQFLQPSLDDIRGFYGASPGEARSAARRSPINGWQVLQDEWEFNKRAGSPRPTTMLPACMKEDPSARP